MAETTVTTSKRFTINWRDILKGLKIAVIAPVLAIIYKSIQEGSLTFNWKVIGLAAVGGLISYLIKNFLEPGQIVITNPSTASIESVNDGSAEAKVVVK